MRWTWLMLLAGLVACSGDSKTTPTGDDDDDATDVAGDDDDDATDVGNDTYDSGGGGPVYFDPVAVGFEFYGTVNSDGTLGNYLIDGYEYLPIVVLTFADLDFFYATDYTQQEGHFCTAIALFSSDPAYGGVLPMAKPNQLVTHDAAVLNWSYETALQVEVDYHDCGPMVDPAVWGEDASGLVDPFNGAHFGIGFGPMTDYLREAWSQETLDEFESSMAAVYIAINDANGDWVAYDWTTAIWWQNDPTTNEVTVDAEGLLVPLPIASTPTGADLPEGFVQSYAYWYQDFPLMDFSNLQDGAP